MAANAVAPTVYLVLTRENMFIFPYLIAVSALVGVFDSRPGRLCSRKGLSRYERISGMPANLAKT